MIRPDGFLGVTSPYPTVVTVCSAHHMPTQMFRYSLWSRTRIKIPPPATTTAVVETITPAATRTLGGSLKTRDSLRSKIECLSSGMPSSGEEAGWTSGASSWLLTVCCRNRRALRSREQADERVVVDSEPTEVSFGVLH